jgi:hypothetical protein
LTESFLHYLWQFQYFTKKALTTSRGEPIQIFHPGIRNSNAGPDFSDARIAIGELEWRGTVEIHIKASGWHDHHHGDDAAYENVILHVVWENDKKVMRSDGSEMPTLELKDRVDLELWGKYKTLYTSAEKIPCAHTWNSVQDVIKLSMLDKALSQRLESKAKRVMELLEKNLGDWEETCYQLVCMNFGFKVNTDPFLQLARSLPYKILLKHSDQPMQQEALLFGQAGFLEKTCDEEYPKLLQREYSLLSKKYGLGNKQLHTSQWRLLRLRPANFPTIRLAQVAALIHKRRNLFSLLIATPAYDKLFALLDVEQSEYWKTHYQIGKVTEHVPSLGKSSIQNLIINTVVPLLAAYSITHDDQVYMDGAIEILHYITAEKNVITRNWSEIGYTVRTAFDSQALLELYNSYCQKRRCLECVVGSSLIRP